MNTSYTNTPTLKSPDAIEFYFKPGWLRDLATWRATKAPSRYLWAKMTLHSIRV
jgi:hypothetical protein